MPRMRVCVHCKEGFQLATTGRPPTYCSATCRKAAWEARKLQETLPLPRASRRRAGMTASAMPLFSDER